ncbi:DUF6350 family protein [Kitasatospora sp. NPDC058965]|uniref:cell division protein PerM n=1 Tax=Kitasatospora sp. NPDC058965 TaxID=3346682 RepID=UPI0036943B6E
MTHHHLTGRPFAGPAAARAGGPGLAGMSSALLGLAGTAVPVLVLWVLTATPQDSAADAARLAGALWLLGHGGPLVRGGAPLSLTPLLLTLAVLLLVRRAAGRAAAAAGVRRASVPPVLCAGYLLVALPVALFCQGAGALRAEPLPDLAAVGLLVYAAAAVGARTGPGWWPAARRWAARAARWRAGRPGPGPAERPVRWLPAPPPARPVFRAAAAGGLTLLAGGALLFAVVLVLRTDATDPVVRELAGSSLPGLLGLLLSCLLLAPDAVLWAVGYALGPGFAVGSGTVVAPGTVRLGAVPEFPLLALVPSSGSGWQRLVLLVPLAAGAVVAVLLARAAQPSRQQEEQEEREEREEHGEHPEPEQRRGPEDAAQPPPPGGTSPDGISPGSTALAAAGAAGLVGAAVALAGWLAQGAVGGGRMAVLGPAAGCGPAAAGWIAAVAVPGAPALSWWWRRRAGRTPAPVDPPVDGPEPELPALPAPARSAAAEAGARLLDRARRGLGRG